MSGVTVQPDDRYNRVLVDHVHPSDWATPTPADRYNLVVIGGGPAGLVAALGAAGLGARVALVERHLLGGDCLNWGCVPSKAVLRSAHAAAAAREAGPLGVDASEVAVDFGAVMERMRAIRASIGPHDSAARLRDEGIDVFLGDARFTGPDTVAVGELRLRFARCCIATGARALVPPIDGLDEVGVLTNEELFALTERPASLVVVGAGVIGCEMAQAFARLGSRVALVDLAPRVLPREEADAAALVQQALVRDGVALHLGVKVARMARRGGARVVVLDDGTELTGDQILVAVGRRPNVELDLDAAGIAHTRQGITVDDRLRTSNPRVFAAGDVIGQAQFTHAADHQARVVIRNALFFGRARVSDLVIPRVTYTHPEVAAVGISLDEAERDPAITTITVPLAETDRGRTDGDAGDYLRIHHDRRGHILGATVVSDVAGELLAPITLAMTHGLTLGQIAATIHPYPTRSEALFKAASAYNRSRLPTWAARVLPWILSLRR